MLSRPDALEGELQWLQPELRRATRGDVERKSAQSLYRFETADQLGQSLADSSAQGLSSALDALRAQIEAFVFCKVLVL